MKVLIITGRILLYFTGSLLVPFLLFYLLSSGTYEVAETVEQDPTIPHIFLGGNTFHSELSAMRQTQ
jgi:hypothetical protein